MHKRVKAKPNQACHGGGQQTQKAARNTDRPDTTQVLELLSTVCDPEIPVLTLQDLGVLREVSIADGEVIVTITPTYTGCPAMERMRQDIEDTLAAAGYARFTVRNRLSPAWTTDWMSDSGREKLRAYGIAPPAHRASSATPACGAEPTGGIACPQCKSEQVRRISEFGSTACKALYQCRDCREPFDYFKCI